MTSKVASLVWTLALSVAAPVFGQAPIKADRSASQQAQAPPPDSPPSNRSKIKRWIDWQAGTIDTRYRFIETSEGETTSNQQQHRQTLRAALKLDAAGRYTIVGGAATGGSLTSGWDNLGPGRGDPTWDISLRQLFLSAQPVAGITAQVGGLYAVRGENTEITSYDNDTYQMGVRLTVQRPETLYLDEITATFGNYGDKDKPNVFRRFRQIDNHNYSQVLAARKFGELVAASAEWSSHEGISTLRQAVAVRTKDWLPLDSVRFQQYQRVEGDEGYGFGISVERELTGRLGVSGGYASIDEGFPPLNGDRYLRGKRLFGQVDYALRPDLGLTVFYTQAFEDDFVIPNQHRFEIVLSYNVLKSLQALGAW